MKILVISYHTCPVNKLGSKDSGGLNIYLREISKELGVEIKLIAEVCDRLESKGLLIKV